MSAQIDPAIIKINPKLITTQHQLIECCKYLASQQIIGIDVESDMNAHFGSNLSLIQIGTHNIQYLIDSQEFDSSGINQILADPTILKIFFDGHQDISMLKRELNGEIRRIFDIAWAYKFLNSLNQQKGLNELIFEYFGVTISKKLQRTDWSRRPLTKPMIHYAAADVTYLDALYQILFQQIKKRGWKNRIRRFFDSFENIQPINSAVDQKLMFLRIKQFGFLNQLEKLIVKRLHDFRTEWGLKYDRPVGFILSNKEILQLAQQQPHTEKELIVLEIARLGLKSKIKSKVLHVIKLAKDQFTQDHTIYDKEIKELEILYNQVGRRHLHLINSDYSIAMDIDPAVFHINRKRLEYWRLEQSEQTGVPKDFFLSQYTIQELSVLDFSKLKLKTIPLVPGISKVFQEKLGSNLYTLLTMPDDEYLTKIKRKYKD